jgi:hypothetical protein
VSTTETPELFVSSGLGGDSWATYRRRPTGSLERVKSPKLPLRTTEREALLDLKEYASQKSLSCPSREEPKWRAIWLAAWERLDPQAVASYLKGQEEFRELCDSIRSGRTVKA